MMSGNDDEYAALNRALNERQKLRFSPMRYAHVRLDGAAEATCKVLVRADATPAEVERVALAGLVRAGVRDAKIWYASKGAECWTVVYV